MFEWLEEEMAKMNTPHFYEIDGPATEEFREVLEDSDLPVPQSYREFVLKFGNAKLYRKGSYYLVEVYAGPRIAGSKKGEPLLQFGRTHLSLAYFRQPSGNEASGIPVFEWSYGRGLRKSADTFEEWLRKVCRKAKSSFADEEWRDLQSGPSPFTPEEERVVLARSKFRWRQVGITEHGRVQFEVYNGSDRVLPYLSIGIKGRLRKNKSQELDGGAYLDVHSIQPGETKIVEKKCYIENVDPVDIKSFELPEPEPATRDLYWEFRTEV